MSARIDISLTSASSETLSRAAGRTVSQIVPPEKLVFVVSFTDEKGNAVRHPMSPTWPLHVLNTLTFSEQDRRTTLLMRAVPIDATESERKTFARGFEAMRGGFGATLDQLAAYLAGATKEDSR